MIIEKILGISNLGKIIDWKADGKAWNGQLNKITAIYADNGSGKTTILRGMKIAMSSFFSGFSDINTRFIDEFLFVFISSGIGK